MTKSIFDILIFHGLSGHSWVETFETFQPFLGYE